jgi:hypothetical protein
MVTTLSALRGTFDDTHAANTVYHCERAGQAEICVDATDGACVKTSCMDVSVCRPLRRWPVRDRDHDEFVPCRAPRRFAAFAVLTLLLLASPAAADDALRARAAEAFEAARAHTLSEPLDGRLDAVWHTDLVLQIRPDPQLQWWANVRRRLLSKHRTYRLVEPSAPLMPLPEDPGTGLQKWYVYMQAPFGTPPSTALRYITEYLAPDTGSLAPPAEGYILTHQLAVLEWAKMVGLELPLELLKMEPSSSTGSPSSTPRTACSRISLPSASASWSSTETRATRSSNARSG